MPIDEPIAVAFSGGVDSTAVLLMAVRANAAIGGSPDRIRAFTLDLGGGRDAAQAERVVRDLGLEQQWERIVASPADFDLEAAIRLIEDYHPLDVECAATAVCLLRGIRERYPRLTYLLDGDGGDENLKSYPLEDSDLTLSSILRNPLLYQEGWGVDAIKHSLAYSGGLSRGYVRTYAPAAALGFDAFSPFTTRSVIASAVAIPFEQVLAGDASRLGTLKQDVVQRRRQGDARRRDAGQSEAAIPGRRRGDAARAGVEGVVPADLQQALAGSATGRRLTGRRSGTRLSACNARCEMQNANRRMQQRRSAVFAFEFCILNYPISSCSLIEAQRTS